MHDSLPGAVVTVLEGLVCELLVVVLHSYGKVR